MAEFGWAIIKPLVAVNSPQIRTGIRIRTFVKHPLAESGSGVRVRISMRIGL